MLLASCVAALAEGPSFVPDEATFRLGESVMVPLSRTTIDGPLDVALTVDPPERAEVLRDVGFLAGHATGFARIRTLSPGDAVLRAGDATMRLRVLSERPAALIAKMRPVITSPSEESAAWGVIAVGADIWVGAPGVDRMAAPDALLHLPDGRELPPSAMFPPVDGPFWRLAFEMDADSLQPGDHELFVSCRSPYADGPDAARLSSKPHGLHILPPPADDEWVFAGECEDALDTPRSERMGADPPGVTMESGASNFRAVALRRTRPPWVVQAEIPETGRYQLMVRARGTLAGSAYPSVGLVLGEQVSDSGSVRLAHADWHRVPVGRPVRIEAGAQWIGLTLSNEFNYRNQIVRMAEIDRYELRRVPDTAAGGGSAMMMDGAMAMAGADAPSGDRKTRVARGLNIAFTSIFDGESANGTVRVRASLHTPAFRADNDYRDIRTDLWVNGRPIATGSGRYPDFALHPHDLKRGPNEIVVTALSPCGNIAETTSQVLHATATGHPETPLATAEGEDAAAPHFIDASPPEIRIIHPQPGSTVDSGGDCLVLDVFDDLGITGYELHIDGEKHPLIRPHTRETGPVVLHLPASLLPPGERVIAVIARDASGKTTRTPDLPVVSKTDDSATLTHAYPRAVRLARRLAYGVDDAVIAAILTHGEQAWLDGQLDGPQDTARHAAIEALARQRHPNVSSANNVRGRVAHPLLLAPDPVRARFTQFAMNHFSTWIAKTGAPALGEEYAAFRAAGVPRFSDLLLISATSPAMMVYLDQQNSLGRQLNENYAREIMELHTVGVHAGYTQDDVTALAHLLTGWGAQREALMDGSATGFNYRFSPYLNHNESIEIFGISIPPAASPEQADDRIAQAIEMLTARPETARFIAGKLTAHILGHPACEDTADRLASAFITSGGDFRVLIRKLAASPALMARDLPPKLLHPLEFAVATQRSADFANPGHILTLTDRSGRGIFDRASPDGYPEHCQEYADSNYQLQKWNFCRELEAQLAAPFAHGWFDATLLEDPAHRDAVIDAASHARFGAAPAPATREALHQIMTQPISDQTQRRRLFAAFLHMTPEAQFR